MLKDIIQAIWPPTQEISPILGDFQLIHNSKGS